MPASRLAAVRGVSLADQARDSIRRAILSGTLPLGERVTIEQLAAELGVSRTPVREALKALEGDGLIRLLPHRGVLVESMAREEIEHRYEIRAMLESYAARLAFENDAVHLAEELRGNCDRLQALAEDAGADDVEVTASLSALNQEFHALIREGSRSRTLIRLLESLGNPAAYALAYWGDPERREASVRIHRQIADAFLDGDAERVGNLMERHLLDARDQLLSGDDAISAVGGDIPAAADRLR